MFGYGDGIIYLAAEIPDGTFDLCVPVQQLDRAVACLLPATDQRQLRADRITLALGRLLRVNPEQQTFLAFVGMFQRGRITDMTSERS